MYNLKKMMKGASLRKRPTKWKILVYFIRLYGVLLKASGKDYEG